MKNFRVHFRDLREDYPQASAAQLYLHTVVDRLCERETLPSVSTELRTSNYMENANLSDLHVDTNTRWFDAYRELTLRFSQPSDHEFLRTFVACLFVVSTSSTEPLAAFSNLVTEQYTHQHAAATRYPRWFHSTVLKHFILLHDSSESKANAEALFEDLKMAYGPPNCTLITVNSQVNADSHAEGSEPSANPFAMLMQYDALAGACVTSLNAATVPSSFNSSYQFGKLNAAALLGSSLKNSASLSVISKSEEPTLKGSASTDFASDSDSVSSVTVNSNLLNGNGSFLNDPLEVDEIATAGYDAFASQTPVERSAFVTPSAVRYGALISPSDVDKLRAFVSDFLLHGVLPFLERSLRTLADGTSNSKKSVQRRFVLLVFLDCWAIMS